jgi:hypothetical protein
VRREEGGVRSGRSEKGEVRSGGRNFADSEGVFFNFSLLTSNF